MTRIVVKVSRSDKWTVIVKELSKVEDVGISELKARLDQSLPVLRREMFGNDHEVVATELMSFVDFLEESESAYQIYELDESDDFEVVDLDLYQISRSSLRRIIGMHEKEIARQRSMDDID